MLLLLLVLCRGCPPPSVLSDGRAVVCNVPSPTFSVQAVPVPTELSPGVDVMGAVEVATFSPVDAVLAVG